jgi:hypothetical protein
MTRGSQMLRGTLGCLLLFSISAAAAASYEPQDDLKTKVRKIIELPFPKDAEKSRKELRRLGAPAIPYIFTVVESDSQMNPIKKTFLIDVIASFRDESSVSALMDLLSNNDPYVRGLAATHLGEQRSRAALPKLISLLNDRGVYKTVEYTDPSSEQLVLVRDVAIDALQTVTGAVLARHGTKEQQAQAWMRWWRKHRGKKGIS